MTYPAGLENTNLQLFFILNHISTHEIILKLQVRYNVTGWLEKNKDPLNDSAVGVLKASPENELLRTIWASYQTQEDQAKAQSKCKL